MKSSLQNLRSSMNTPRYRHLLVATSLLGALASFASNAAAVGTRHFVVEKKADFSAGELEGVAVDSRGHLRAGLSLADLEVADVSSAWGAVEHEGALYVATGSEGKLVRIRGEQVDIVAGVEAIALTSVVVAWGKPVVAAMPGGKLYRLEGSELKEFASLEGEPHVWAMAFDEDSKALFVATGPDGKLFRVTEDGTAQVYFDSDQNHLVSVAAGVGKSAGHVFAGSSGKARLYDVAAPGRASVVYDFERTEVRGIVTLPNGSVLAIANELSGGPRSDSVSAGKPAGPSHKKSKKGKGVLYRFSADGEPELLLEEKSEHFVTLSVDASGRALVGGGAQGRVYRATQGHRSSVLADIDSRQVTSVFVDGSEGWVVASDPVMVHPVRGVGGTEAVWTSKALDAGLRARFGRMDWDASGKVSFATRSGATAEPDETWTDWSAELTAPGQIQSSAGRFLQVRATLVGGERTVLRRVDIPFVTDNARAVLTELTAKSAATSTGTTGIAKSGQPLADKAKPTIDVSWKVDNPDKDELRYLVEYRAVGSDHWFDALEPGKVHTKTSLSWDTGDLPEGRYRLRVTASDELSNPPDRVKRHVLESAVVLVDNTAPRIEALRVAGRKVSGIARDEVGPVRRIEVRVGGRLEWIPFEPKDGIFDEAKEDFAIDLTALAIEGPATVTLRVFDTAGNSEVRHLQLNGI